MRNDLAAKGGDAVGKIAEKCEPEEEVALRVEESLSKLRPFERLIVDSSVVVANHLDSCHFFFVAEESGAALGCWEEDVDDDRPNDANSANDKVDPLPR